MTEDTHPMTAENAQRINHALQAFMSTIEELTDTGANPAEIASALNACYCHYLTVFAASAGRPKSDIIPAIVQSVESLESYIDELFDKVSGDIKAYEAAENDQQ